MRRLLALLLFLTGLALVLTPLLLGQWRERQMATTVTAMRQAEAAPSTKTPPTPTTPRAKSQDATAAADPFDDSRLLDFLKPVSHPATGYVEIPSLNERLPLYASASRGNLNHGVGLIPQTGPLNAGPGTNTAIAGHRGWYGGRYFRDINQLRPGQMVRIHQQGAIYRYKVRKTVIIRPRGISQLVKDPRHELMTLVTCHPRHSSRYRLLVYTERV